MHIISIISLVIGIIIGYFSIEKKVRFKIDREMWNELIRGKTIEKNGAKFFLQDIGFDILRFDLAEAHEELYRRKKRGSF